MSSRETTASLFKKMGWLPQTIADSRGLKISTILSHIWAELGSGGIRPVEIVAAYIMEVGDGLEQLYVKHGNHARRIFIKHAVNLGLTAEEAALYYEIRTFPSFRGDIYVLITDIEVAFHSAIKSYLVERYGSEETQWWRKGIPEKIRKKCVDMREVDSNPVDPYYYTDIVDIKEILEKQWKEIFQHIFPNREVLDLLLEMKNLRNAIMHAIRIKPVQRSELIAIARLSDLMPNIDTSVMASGRVSQADKKIREIIDRLKRITVTRGNTTSENSCRCYFSRKCDCNQWWKWQQTSRLKSPSKAFIGPPRNCTLYIPRWQDFVHEAQREAEGVAEQAEGVAEQTEGSQTCREAEQICSQNTLSS